MEPQNLLGASARQPRVATEKGCLALGRWPRSMLLSASSQMKEARRRLERQGFIVTKTHGGHWRFSHSEMDGLCSPQIRRPITAGSRTSTPRCDGSCSLRPPIKPTTTTTALQRAVDLR